MTSGTRARAGSRARDRTVTLLLASVALAFAVAASAQQAPAPPPSLPEGSGAIAGRVVDATSGAPIADARVIVTWPAPADGGEPHEEVEVTDANGDFRFAAIPEGSYAVEFVKSGYTGSTLRDFAVRAGETQRADLRMAVGADEASGPPAGVEEVLVLGARVEAMEASRQESDEMINTLTAADISKFAATDIADVILRVPGVNVVEGQFAIIRGLEDRYSSTLYNSAPIPSPDPDRQSPQLDLFANEIVSDLVVAKTFVPDLPSNSSGGSINILTRSPAGESFEATVKAKTGYNTHAIDDFLELNNGSPIGDPIDGFDTIDQEYGAAFTGFTEVLGREIRTKGIFNWGRDFETGEGFQETQEPRNMQAAPGNLADLSFGDLGLSAGRYDLTTSEEATQTTGYGGFGFNLDEEGYHQIDFSVFYTQKDQDIVDLRENGFFPDQDYAAIVAQANAGQDVFFTEDFDGTVSPTGGRSTLTSWMGRSFTENRRNVLELVDPQNGALFFSSFSESRSFKTDRDLLLTQLNGDHSPEWLEGLSFRWAGNWAKTSQNEDALGTRFFFEPCGFSFDITCPEGTSRIEIPTEYPVTVDSLGPGRYAAGNQLFRNTTNIDEHQYFGRGDADYELELTEWLTAKASTGLWYERAKRDIDASYLAGGEVGAACTSPTATRCSANSPQIYAIYGDSAQELGSSIFSFALVRGPNGEFASTQLTESDAKREIQAWHATGKGTFFDQVDVFGGVRLEKIHIESNNDPFQPGQSAFDLSPLIFPSKYVFFDRMDNIFRNEFPRQPPFNSQVLGLQVPSGPCRDLSGNAIPGGGECVDLIDQAEIESVVNGEIDETKALPAAGITYRPLEGLALRGAWSQTVARPSFREMGYYVTTEPATDDLILGNPQLQLSDVDSYDLRVEYFFGDLGDLVAASFFYKTIEKPIESVIVRDAGNFDDSSTALYRTYFNNENEASLWGVELEARKYFDFVPLDFAEFFSVGGNFTWIDAEVDRSEFEVARAQPFFGAPPGTDTVFSSLDQSRRLYGQPEWIVNADVSFDQPDWGTSVTLAFFGISDVLDAAGTAFVGQDNALRSLTLDRYLDSFQTLDLVVSQKLWGGLGAKFTARNLTNSRRDIVYDAGQTLGKFEERSEKLGTDFSIEVNYTFTGDDVLGLFGRE